MSCWEHISSAPVSIKINNLADYLNIHYIFDAFFLSLCGGKIPAGLKLEPPPKCGGD